MEASVKTDTYTTKPFTIDICTSVVVAVSHTDCVCVTVFVIHSSSVEVSHSFWVAVTVSHAVTVAVSADGQVVWLPHAVEVCHAVTVAVSADGQVVWLPHAVEVCHAVTVAVSADGQVVWLHCHWELVVCSHAEASAAKWAVKDKSDRRFFIVNMNEVYAKGIGPASSLDNWRHPRNEW